MSDSTLAQDIAALSPRVLEEGIRNDDNAEKARIAVYNHIHTRILPNVTREECIPPLHVVLYAARANLQPHIVPKEIPRLLEYLATVDYARQKAVRQIENILKIDTEHKRHGSPLTALTSRQRKKVVEAKGELVELRKVYRDIVCGLCLYHVYETGALKEDVSGLLLMYFPVPGLWDEDVSSIETKYPFHHNLTDLERKQLGSTVQEYLKLLTKFIEDNPPDLSPLQFRLRYPYPSQGDPRRVASQALEYLEKLEYAIHVVESALK
ncbi:hypothetical protein PHLGIDRAFT_124919 [Phlebiopsis gigantea 11061_1 CR5-6]|uniref:Uncharacterized protein n=1 Tax=Phlebiopsis gigantea (strain 11061_1 CR5-6) TaxID=745531 RepID=A0A0C3PUC6_PHLG1|nr:hypothetical protein PHLGIDRAFT_124919 [Phlebiopsis gigantea 11061_1 CR5-6]